MTSPCGRPSPPKPGANTPGRFAAAFSGLVVSLIVVRIGLLFLLNVGGGQPLQPDSPLYLELAAGLADQGWFSSSADTYVPEVFRTPGYPAYLALFHWAGTQDIFWPLLIQEIIYLTVVGVFYFGTRALLDPGLARAVLIFLLIEPGGIAYPKLILSDTLNLLFIASAVFALGLHLKRRGQAASWYWLIGAGLLLGCAAWVRPAAFLLPFIFAPVLLIAGRLRPPAFAQAATLIVITTLALSPWLLRNQAQFGMPYLSGQASNMFTNYHLPYVWEVTRGLPFLQGQKEAQALAQQAVTDEERQLGRPLNQVERLDLDQQVALEALAAHPGAYAQRWVIGVLKTLLGPGLLDAYAAYGHNQTRVRFSQIDEASFARKMQIFLISQDLFVLTEVLARGLVLIFALAGAVVILRTSSPFLWIMMLFTAYTVTIPGPMGLTRLRFAAEGFLFLQAWLGLRCLLKAARSAQRPQPEEG